jgi:hypothetical protein
MFVLWVTHAGLLLWRVFPWRSLQILLPVERAVLFTRQALPPG